MRFQKILKNLAIILLIICAVILAIDVIKNLKININFMKMQSSDRISFSSNEPKVKYEPTAYLIANKEDVLEEIKNLTIELKTQYENSVNKEKLFEIGSIHKIKNLFYDYQKYAVVKYKLLNIIEDLPKLYKETAGYTDSQLEKYFDDNFMHIENYYGITESGKFIVFAKSLHFLSGDKIEAVTLRDSSISFDYDNDILDFYIIIKTESGRSAEYSINIDYYESSDNQVKPYLKITN